MEYFWDTVETIPSGFGFTHFDGFHLAWLAGFVVLTVIFACLYRKFNEKNRAYWRKMIAILLLCDELFKLIPMIIQGYFLPGYLPLHLCSINIFLIVVHAWKPSKLLGNFLYTVCIPGAIAALLFPTWTTLPAANYMLIHSFTVHILLAMYPIVLAVNGDIRPELKLLPKTLGLLVAMAVISCVFNLCFDTNFMFLQYAEPGNPLYWFEQNWGSHLLGFPVLVTAIIFVMYAPVEIIRRVRKK